MCLETALKLQWLLDYGEENHRKGTIVEDLGIF